MATLNQTWAVVELMGHVKLAGIITEEEKFGAKLGRLDIPQEDDSFVTQIFSGSSVYRITFVTEEVARKVARQSSDIAPVKPWDFPKPVVEAPALPWKTDYQHDEDREQDYDYQEDL